MVKKIKFRTKSERKASAVRTAKRHIRKRAGKSR